MVIFIMMCMVIYIIAAFFIIGILGIWILMAIIFIFYCNITRLIRFLVLFLF